MGNNLLQLSRPGDYLVLLYHGVYADGTDLSGRNSSRKHISTSEFEFHMDTIARDWNIVSMIDILMAHQQQVDLPPRSVAITFDDGFSNVYHNAWPILRRYGLKATFYLATGFVDTGRASWTDQLEMMILEADVDYLSLVLEGEQLEFTLDNMDERISALTDIKRKAKQLPFQEVRLLLERVEASTGVSPVSSHPIYQMVTWDQVRELANDECFDVGAHTVNHIPVSRSPYEEMVWEISESVRRVSEEIGEETKLFSYPEGQAMDFDEKSINFLKSIDFEFCPTAIDGVNNIADTDPFHIYRCMVGFEGRPFILT